MKGKTYSFFYGCCSDVSWHRCWHNFRCSLCQSLLTFHSFDYRASSFRASALQGTNRNECGCSCQRSDRSKEPFHSLLFLLIFCKLFFYLPKSTALEFKGFLGSFRIRTIDTRCIGSCRDWSGVIVTIVSVILVALVALVVLVVLLVLLVVVVVVVLVVRVMLAK